MKVLFSTDVNRRPLNRDVKVEGAELTLIFGYIDVLMDKTEAVWLMSELARGIAWADSVEKSDMEKREQAVKNAEAQMGVVQQAAAEFASSLEA